MALRRRPIHFLQQVLDTLDARKLTPKVLAVRFTSALALFTLITDVGSEICVDRMTTRDPSCRAILVQLLRIPGELDGGGQHVRNAQ